MTSSSTEHKISQYENITKYLLDVWNKIEAGFVSSVSQRNCISLCNTVVLGCAVSIQMENY